MLTQKEKQQVVKMIRELKELSGREIYYKLSPYIRQKTNPMIIGKLVLTTRGKPVKKEKKKYRQTMEEWRKKRWHL